MHVDWNEPEFGKTEKELVCNVLDSGYVSEGPMTKKLEEELAKVVGTKHVIMTTSCTAALYLAIEADKKIIGYSTGNVIIPSMTFVATKNAVELAGLTPKIEDVCCERFVLDQITFSDDTKIIIPVNLLGRDSGYGAWATKTVICDNAGALGSDVSNGTVGCYSLQGNKLISCGQGGFCATDNDEYARVIRELKDFGRGDKYDNNTTGFNFKFNDILAAVALGQLEDIEYRKQVLTEQYKFYKHHLRSYGHFIDYKITEVPLWVEFICNDRDDLYDYLLSQNIKCRKPWKPLKDGGWSSEYYRNVLWLPNGIKNGNEKLKYVVKRIKEFYDGHKRDTQ